MKPFKFFTFNLPASELSIDLGWFRGMEPMIGVTWGKEVETVHCMDSYVFFAVSFVKFRIGICWSW